MTGAPAIIDPDRPIIDAHHHLFDRPTRRYLADELRADLVGGHRIVASVHIEAGGFLRPDGPAMLRPLGEVEFANGVAAMAAADWFGGTRVGTAIVGHADLRYGDAVAELLDRSIATAPDRYRGVRQMAMDHPSDTPFRAMPVRPPRGLLADTAFRAGFRHLAPRRLSFDLSVFHVQFDEVADLADAFPDTVLILDHMGMVMGLDDDAAGRIALRHAWAAGLRELARRPNIVCKIGGLGMPLWGFGFEGRPGQDTLVAAWAPYVDAAIAGFGADRCMMASNFPIDAGTCDYATLWNVLKRIVAGHGEDAKTALFAGTAARIYRIPDTEEDQ